MLSLLACTCTLSYVMTQGVLPYMCLTCLLYKYVPTLIWSYIYIKYLLGCRASKLQTVFLQFLLH